MSPQERTVLPAVLRHSQKFYDALDDQSVVEIVNDVPIKVFRGRVTQVYNSLGISQSYYSQVTKALADNGCVTYIQRGARGAESVLALHHPPKEDEWLQPNRTLTERGAFGILSQQVRNIENSLGGLDVALAIATLQQEVTGLRDRVRKLESGR